MTGDADSGRYLVFERAEQGTLQLPENIAVRYMQPALTKAALRKYRLHALRHTSALGFYRHVAGAIPCAGPRRGRWRRRAGQG